MLKVQLTMYTKKLGGEVFKVRQVANVKESLCSTAANGKSRANNRRECYKK